MQLNKHEIGNREYDFVLQNNNGKYGKHTLIKMQAVNY